MSPKTQPAQITTAQPEGQQKVYTIKGSRSGDQYTATKINGDSLKGDGIYNGALLIIRLEVKPNDLTPGRLVLVDTPFGRKVRHYYLTPDKRVRLIASNDDYLDLTFAQDQVEIIGVVVYQ